MHITKSVVIVFWILLETLDTIKAVVLATAATVLAVPLFYPVNP